MLISLSEICSQNWQQETEHPSTQSQITRVPLISREPCLYVEIAINFVRLKTICIFNESLESKCNFFIREDGQKHKNRWIALVADKILYSETSNCDTVVTTKVAYFLKCNR